MESVFGGLSGSVLPEEQLMCWQRVGSCARPSRSSSVSVGVSVSLSLPVPVSRSLGWKQVHC